MSYDKNIMASQIESLQLEIADNEVKIKTLWDEIKDFSTVDYVRAERVGKKILSIRGEINSIKKKIEKLRQPL